MNDTRPITRGPWNWTVGPWPKLVVGDGNKWAKARAGDGGYVLLLQGSDKFNEGYEVGKKGYDSIAGSVISIPLYAIRKNRDKSFSSLPYTCEADARLIASAPAMALCLELLALGLARIEPATKEFCFGGLRYSCLDWSKLLDLIGWGVVRDAISKAKGKP